MTQSLLFIFLGGGLGAVLRYGLSHFSRVVLGASVGGTLAANLVGAFLMGLLMAWSGTSERLSPSVQLGLTAGLLGGLTTFSTFSFETLEFLKNGEVAWGALYGLGSLLGCLFFCGLGYRMFAPLQG